MQVSLFRFDKCIDYRILNQFCNPTDAPLTVTLASTEMFFVGKWWGLALVPALLSKLLFPVDISRQKEVKSEICGIGQEENSKMLLPSK